MWLSSATPPPPRRQFFCRNGTEVSCPGMMVTLLSWMGGSHLAVWGAECLLTHPPSPSHALTLRHACSFSELF